MIIVDVSNKDYITIGDAIKAFKEEKKIIGYRPFPLMSSIHQLIKVGKELYGLFLNGT
jgi:hypothetical protein